MKTKLLFLALIVVFGGCNGERTKERNDNYTSHALQCDDANGWDIAIRLNGIPVRGNEEGSGISTLNYFVVNGKNTLSVSAARIDKEIREPLQIILWGGDEKSTCKRKLFDIAIESKEAGYKFEKTYTFDAVVPVQWTWQSAPIIEELTAPDRQAILDEIHAFFESIKSRDIDATLKIIELATGDLAKYEGASFKDTQDISRKCLSSADFKPEIASDEAILIEVGERAVLVSGPRDEHNCKTSVITLVPLSESPDKESCAYHGVSLGEIVLCKKDGKWRIVMFN